jgi:Putative Ig domain
MLCGRLSGKISASCARFFGPSAPLVRRPRRIQLSVESLEDRVVPTIHLALTPIPNQTVVQGQPVSLQVVATDTNPPVVTLTFSIHSGSLPPGLTLSASSGLISGTITPGGASPATYYTDVWVDDDRGSNNGSAFDWTVNLLPTNTPPTQCNCGCPSELIVGEPTGAMGTDPDKMTIAPIRYADGTVDTSAFDLSSAGVGPTWGQTRSWTNVVGYTTGQDNGSGWVDSQAPHLLEVDGTTSLAAVFDGTTALFFNYSDGAYIESFGGVDNLMYDSTADTYSLAMGSGQVIVFDGFGTSTVTWASGRLGQFASMTDADGTSVAVTLWSDAGQIEEVQADAGGITDSYQYAYLTSGVNSGLLASVTLRRKVDTVGTWNDVQSVDYTYYDGTNTGAETGGNAGDLQTAIVKDPSENVLSVDYYRYYVPDESNGFEHALKYVVTGAAFAQLQNEAGTFDDALSASNSTVALYADNYFQYDGDGRVDQEVASGAGCSVCSSGQGTFTYTYTISGNSPGPNSWAVKTVETLPDGVNTNTVYTNANGDIMLSVYDAGASQQSATYYEYDDNGRCILTAQPSAVAGYNDTYPDLVHFVEGHATYLSDNSGMITDYNYSSSTSATTSAAGDVNGYLQSVALQDGQSGTSIPQESWTYIEHIDATGVCVYNVDTDTVYRDTAGAVPETTSYSYTYFTISGSATNQIETLTTTLPTVTTAQNGSNSVTSTVAVYNIQGQVVWTKDANGVIDYFAYDPATGSIIRQVNDVDVSAISDPTESASWSSYDLGWTTTSTGLAQTTTRQVDALGRTVEETSPNGNITWTVYDDPDHEVRTYVGWNPTTGTTTGPTEVYDENWALGYTETLTMTATPATAGSSGALYPTGAESISGVVSLSRELLNNAGQETEEDDYYYLSGGWSYSNTSQTLGSSSTNYYSTTYAYNADGYLDKTVTPSGTIYRTVYNGQGWVISTWVGTDDTPTTGYWSPTNLAGTNMVETEADVYDNGGVGDGNLTQQTLFTGASTVSTYTGVNPNQVTQYLYDWRDRLIAEKSGVQSSESDGTNRPITVLTYDNLNEVTKTQTFDGDGLTLTPGLVAELVSAASTPAFALGSGIDVTAVATDSSGDVFLAGSITGTVTFGSGSGSVGLSASSGAGFVAEYSSSGSFTWVQQTAATINGIAVDAYGAVYVVGQFTGSATFGMTFGPSTTLTNSETDGFVWKLSGSGDTVWAVPTGIDYVDGGYASISGVAVGDGHVYAIGGFNAGASFGGLDVTVAGGPTSSFVWKLDASSGDSDWVKQDEGSGGGYAIPPTNVAVAVDASGNAVITGTFSHESWFNGSYIWPSFAGSSDGFVWKLSSSGTTDWVTPTSDDDGSGDGEAFPASVALDASGNVYVGGSYYADATFGGANFTAGNTAVNGFVWKLNSSGDTDWAEVVHESSSGDGSAVTGVAGDSLGNVYAVGTFASSATFGDVTLSDPGPFT